MYKEQLNRQIPYKRAPISINTYMKIMYKYQSFALTLVSSLCSLCQKKGVHCELQVQARRKAAKLFSRSKEIYNTWRLLFHKMNNLFDFCNFSNTSEDSWVHIPSRTFWFRHFTFFSSFTEIHMQRKCLKAC